MRYREGRPEYRQYDSCYYEISADPLTFMEEAAPLADAVQDDPSLINESMGMDADKGEGMHIDDLHLFIQVTKATEMNVYIYEGLDRLTANSSVIKDNHMPVVGETYMVDYISGFLVVAFPNKDIDTDFQFKYWYGEYVPPKE